ncbi:MAG: phosphoribosyltransferase family protein [Acidobacteriota bacterium]|nr:phosphoribosyltransferase family protein [Acidobacteriota bacterium]
MRPLAPETVYDEHTIRERVEELASAITRDTPDGSDLAVLVVLKGAFVFAADLLRRIHRPLRVGFLEIHKDPERPGAADFIFTHPFRIKDADLLLIEDILDTGVTLSVLLQRLRARRPTRIRTAILLDKESRRQVDVPIDYVGFSVPDRWVVGYGLDDDERYRNLPDIRFVEENG